MSPLNVTCPNSYYEYQLFPLYYGLIFCNKNTSYPQYNCMFFDKEKLIFSRPKILNSLLYYSCAFTTIFVVFVSRRKVKSLNYDFLQKHFQVSADQSFETLEPITGCLSYG